MMKTLGKQVLSGLCLALLLATFILATPESTVATTGGNTMKCRRVCCYTFAGICVVPTWICYECIPVDQPYPR